MSSTCAYTPPIKAPTTDSASSSDDKKIEESGTNAAPLQYQCCVCELHDWVFPGFSAGEMCFRCGHVACSWCAVYTRVTEVILGA
jgi:hypothetical protein